MIAIGRKFYGHLMISFLNWYYSGEFKLLGKIQFNRERLKEKENCESFCYFIKIFVGITFLILLMGNLLLPFSI